MSEQTTTTNGLEANGRGGPALFKALAEFQATRPRAMKDAKSNFAKYATYESVLDAISGAHKLGLCFSHIMDEDMMVTVLAHTSGEYITSRMRVLADRQNAHGWGSGMSFTKRYCISAMLGIATAEDDDGNAAMASTGHGHQTKKGWREKEAKAKAEAERKAKHSQDFKDGKTKYQFPRLKELGLPRDLVDKYVQHVYFDSATGKTRKLSALNKREMDMLLDGLSKLDSDIRKRFNEWRTNHG